MVWISKGEKAIDVEIEKHVFGKQMFAGPGRDNGTQRGILLARFLPVLIIASCWVDSLPGICPSSTFFRQLGERSKVLPESFGL